ncbi:MAG: (2Fe-2S) ferredoxin domain-containing protein [Armatimonadota bacterium]
MRRIEVCMGSSCYLKGAYQVLDTFTALIRQHGLEGEVTLAGAFCKEHCRQGVSVQIDQQVYSVPDPATARELFSTQFLPPAENPL